MNMVADRQPNLMGRLELIEAGRLDVDAARGVVREALAEPDDEISEEVYASLRGWTGRALRGAFPGEDLRAWYALVAAAASRMGEGAGWGIRVEVLAELLYERAGMAESRAPEKIATRRHAPEILALLASQPTRAISRAEIGADLRLGQANLTRVCNLLADAGLVLRRAEGRTASYEITATGLAHAARPAAAATVEAIAADLGGSWDVSSGADDGKGQAPSTPIHAWDLEALAGWGTQDAANDDFEYAMAA